MEYIALIFIPIAIWFFLDNRKLKDELNNKTNQLSNTTTLLNEFQDASIKHYNKCVNLEKENLELKTKIESINKKFSAIGKTFLK